jgi:hypothetical protein
MTKKQRTGEWTVTHDSQAMMLDQTDMLSQYTARRIHLSGDHNAQHLRYRLNHSCRHTTLQTITHDPKNANRPR